MSFTLNSCSEEAVLMRTGRLFQSFGAAMAKSSISSCVWLDDLPEL